MAEKVSTLVIEVDLNCTKCYDKIRKVLCKFHCKIISKTFDHKANTVIVTGVFDPECFSKCLMCKAGKVIKDIKVPKSSKPSSGPKKPAESQETEQAREKTETERQAVPVPVWITPVVPYPVLGLLPRPPCYGGYGMPQPCHCGCGGTSSYPQPCHCGCGGNSSYPPSQPQPCHYGCDETSSYPQPCHCGCGGNRRCVLIGEYFCDESQTNSCIIM